MEIKFRVWDTLIKPNGEIGILGMSEEHFIDARPDRFILQQFTGLKDKNGKDIYDGDFVQHLYSIQTEPRIGQVKWGKYSDKEYVRELECWTVYGWTDWPLSCLINSAGYGWSYFGTTVKESVEVIGNIFETPDLIKIV